MSNNPPRPGKTIKFEDWFCSLGVVCATAITLAATWSSADLARPLFDAGLNTGATFIALWFLIKFLRFCFD